MSETPRRHVRRSPSEWQQLIDEQARSGLSQTAFCAARAVSTTSFQHWKRRLAAGASPSSSSPWLGSRSAARVGGHRLGPRAR